MSPIRHLLPVAALALALLAPAGLAEAKVHHSTQPLVHLVAKAKKSTKKHHKKKHKKHHKKSASSTKKAKKASTTHHA